MAFFQRKNGRHLIPLHRDSASNPDWPVVLEAHDGQVGSRGIAGSLAQGARSSSAFTARAPDIT